MRHPVRGAHPPADLLRLLVPGWLRDPEAAPGRVDWNAIFGGLSSTFTAKETYDLTGARPHHVTALIHRWRQEKRIVGTGRDKVRKVGGGR